MMTSEEYAKVIIRSKGISRDYVVRLLWGSQQALADELGITRGAVNHAIFSRSPSRRIEEHVLARIRETRPELESVWARPWKGAVNRVRKSTLAKVAAAIITTALIV